MSSHFCIQTSHDLINSMSMATLMGQITPRDFSLGDVL